VANSSELLSGALSCHKAGEFSDAVSLYREILTREPRHADAPHCSGAVCNQLGNGGLAVELITASRPTLSC
jgi:protein O-GlcNAc transferase